MALRDSRLYVSSSCLRNLRLRSTQLRAHRRRHFHAAKQSRRNETANKKHIPHIDVFDDHIEFHCGTGPAATSGIPLKTKKDGVSNISVENTITNGG